STGTKIHRGGDQTCRHGAHGDPYHQTHPQPLATPGDAHLRAVPGPGTDWLRRPGSGRGHFRSDGKTAGEFPSGSNILTTGNLATIINPATNTAGLIVEAQ